MSPHPRPLLRPGIHPLDRGDGCLQLGLDPAGAVVLPASAAVRSSLQTLSGASTGTPDTGLLGLLEEQGALVDESVLMPLIGAQPRRGAIPRAAGAALVRTSGAGAGDAAAARRRTRVHLTGFGHPDGTDLVDELGGLLHRSGLRPRRPRADHVPGAAPLVGALVGIGEPDRGLLNAWMREATPFVVVRLTEGRALVGPFVDPGSTACLRCVDAHHTDADPAWPLLLQQYTRVSARDRTDGSPEPLDPTVVSLALAWAAHDLVAYADGLYPSSWSATLGVDAHLVEFRRNSWLRHPECGCWWD